MRCIISAYIFLCLFGCGQSTPNISNKVIDSIPQQNINPVAVRKKKPDTPPPSPDKAHLLAKKLLIDSFYFKSSDEAGPFGNPDGMDTYFDFYTWRQSHKNDNPGIFVNEHLGSLGYPKLSNDDTVIATLLDYTTKNEFGSRLISATDAVIVAVAFSQLYLEGTVDKSSKEMARAAMIRQTIPDLMAMWGEPYRTVRKLKFKKMLAVLDNF